MLPSPNVIVLPDAAVIVCLFTWYISSRTTTSAPVQLMEAAFNGFASVMVVDPFVEAMVQ